MRLEVFTPHARLLEEEVDLVEAEDHSGSFEVLEGHCDFFTHLGPGVLSCRSTSGAWRHFAVEGGVFVVRDSDVLVALRDGVEGASLEDVEIKAAHHYGEQKQEEVKTSTALAKMRIAIMKHAMDFDRAVEAYRST